ncbi:MAG: hypothetical protein HYT79_02285 [Elusimicrobia bacterium]|nr:hypothetical protein [Elusimicrobiota bacterium]
MKSWLLGQFERLKQFRVFLVVFMVLHRPTWGNLRVREIVVTLLALLGLIQISFGAKHVFLRAVNAVFVPAQPDIQMQTQPQESIMKPPEAAPSSAKQEAVDLPEVPPVTSSSGDGDLEQLFQGYEKDALSQFGNEPESAQKELPLPPTVEDSHNGPQLLGNVREDVSLSLPLADAPQRPVAGETIALQDRSESRPVERIHTFGWHRNYTDIVLCFLGTVGFGVGIAKLLIMGNAPSLLRFLNCCVLMGLFLRSLYCFVSTSVQSDIFQFIGVALVFISGIIMIKGFSSSYAFGASQSSARRF